MNLPSSVLGMLEIGLNKYIELDDYALRECASLSGKTLAVSLRELGVTLVLAPSASGVQVLSADAKSDAQLEGSLPTFSRLIMSGDDGQADISAGRLRLDGDAEFAHALLQMFREVDFDPEEWLSHVVGDVAAHRFGSLVKGFFSRGRQSADVMGKELANYLTQADGDLVEKQAGAAWMDEVDDLAMSVDRAEARLAKLEQKAGKGAGNSDA